MSDGNGQRRGPADLHLSEEEWIGFALDELSADAQARVDAHIELCSACAAELEGYFELEFDERRWAEEHADLVDRLRRQLLMRHVGIVWPPPASVAAAAAPLPDVATARSDVAVTPPLFQSRWTISASSRTLTEPLSVLVNKEQERLRYESGARPVERPGLMAGALTMGSETRLEWSLDDVEAGVKIVVTASIPEAPDGTLALTVTLESAKAVTLARLEIVDPSDRRRVKTQGPLAMFERTPVILKEGEWEVRITATTDREHCWVIPVTAKSE